MLPRTVALPFLRVPRPDSAIDSSELLSRIASFVISAWSSLQIKSLNQPSARSFTCWHCWPAAFGALAYLAILMDIGQRRAGASDTRLAARTRSAKASISSSDIKLGRQRTHTPELIFRMGNARLNGTGWLLLSTHHASYIFSRMYYEITILFCTYSLYILQLTTCNSWDIELDSSKSL